MLEATPVRPLPPIQYSLFASPTEIHPSSHNSSTDLPCSRTIYLRVPDTAGGRYEGNNVLRRMLVSNLSQQNKGSCACATTYAIYCHWSVSCRTGTVADTQGKKQKEELKISPLPIINTHLQISFGCLCHCSRQTPCPSSSKWSDMRRILHPVPSFATICPYKVVNKIR